MKPNPVVTFIVPGGLDRVTGGNVYDLEVLQRLRSSGWRTEVAASAPKGGGADVVVVDSLAFRDGPPAVSGRLVALAHQLPSEATGRPEWAEAERAVFEAADLTVVVSERLKRRVSAWTDAVIVIHPGRDRAWAPAGPSRDADVVLCVGNATPGKGVPEAIAAYLAARQVLGRGRGAPLPTLVVAGDTEVDPDEARRVRDAAASGAGVRMIGVADAATLSALYGASRALLTASRCEGWPIAVAEAMASRVPVVGFDAPGVNELVRSEWQGLLVPVGDVHALAGALATLLADPSLASVLGAAAHERAMGWPTWAETTSRFARALESLIAGTAAPQPGDG